MPLYNVPKNGVIESQDFGIKTTIAWFWFLTPSDLNIKYPITLDCSISFLKDTLVLLSSIAIVSLNFFRVLRHNHLTI